MTLFGQFSVGFLYGVCVGVTAYAQDFVKVTPVTETCKSQESGVLQLLCTAASKITFQGETGL